MLFLACRSSRSLLNLPPRPGHHALEKPIFSRVDFWCDSNSPPRPRAPWPPLAPPRNESSVGLERLRSLPALRSRKAVATLAAKIQIVATGDLETYQPRYRRDHHGGYQWRWAPRKKEPRRWRCAWWCASMSCQRSSRAPQEYQSLHRRCLQVAPVRARTLAGKSCPGQMLQTKLRRTEKIEGVLQSSVSFPSKQFNAAARRKFSTGRNGTVESAIEAREGESSCHDIP
jgi:hypothetical protein